MEDDGPREGFHKQGGSSDSEDHRCISRRFVRQASWLVDGRTSRELEMMEPLLFATPTCLPLINEHLMR